MSTDNTPSIPVEPHETAPQRVDSSPKESQQQEPAKRQKLSFLNLILIIILFVLVGFIAWTAFVQQGELHADIAVLKDRLSANQSETKTLGDKNKELIEQAQTLMGASSNLKEQVDFNSERLAKLPGAERQDWLLAEAEYLLRLANQRLSLEQDWNGAINMLTAADRVLVETQDPGTDKVRALIAKEIITVRQVPNVDYVGAVHRLQALQESITQLPWVSERILPDVSDQPAKPIQPLAEQWYEKWWRTLTEEVGKMVRIRHRDTAIEAPLSPDQQYYLQQNMRLMLEQAQIALLRREPDLYKHSLERVSDWLNDYIVIEDSRSSAVRDSIKELQGWNVNPKAPAINRSLKTLREYVAQQRRGSITPMASDAQQNGGES